LVVVLAFIYFYGKKSRTTYVGSAYEYQNFSDKVRLKKVVLVGDSIDVIYLNSIMAPNHTYQMDSGVSFRIGRF
jgi:hypothetical protein